MLICTKAKSPVIALPLEVSNLCLRGGCAGAHDPMPCALRVPNHLDYQDCQTSPAVPQQQRALQHGRKLPHDTMVAAAEPGPSFRRVDIRELPKPHSCESLTRPDSSLRFVRWDPRTRSPVYNNVSSSRDAPT